jgi:hypothetical protein
MTSNVPTLEQPDIIYQYLPPTISFNFTQPGSAFTVTPTNGSAGDAVTIVKAPAFTDFGTQDETVYATSTGAAGDYHRTIPPENQEDARLYAFEYTVASADASKVNLDSRIGDTAGYVEDVQTTNIDSGTNGGTTVSVRDLHARESGNNVIFSGYVAMSKLGTTSKTITIPLDTIIST